MATKGAGCWPQPRFRLSQIAALLLLVGGARAGWDSIVQLTRDPASQVLAYGFQRSIATDPEGNLHVVWLDQRTVPSQVWYRRFDRQARIWLPETMVTSQPRDCFYPAVASDGSGNIHLAWHMEDWPCQGLWYKRWERASGRWRPDTLLDTTGASRGLRYPALACRPGREGVHVVWFGYPTAGPTYQVFHKEFVPDSGWQPSEAVTSAECLHEDAAVAVDSAGDVCVVWRGLDWGGLYPQIYSRRRVAGQWQEVELVSDLPGSRTQFAPSVAAGPNGIWHIVWHGRFSNQTYQQVFHRMRTPQGWSGIVTVSGPVPFQQETPSVACRTGNECHVVWRGETGSAPENYQLCHAWRDTRGNWSEPEQLTSLTRGDVTHPAIVCDPDSGLHGVWHDASSGNLDVYYLKGRVAGTGIAEGGSTQLVARTVLAGHERRLNCPLKDGGPGRLTLWSVTGRLVVSYRLAQGEGSVVELPDLAAGLYLVRLTTSAGSTTEKLVIQR